MQPHDKQERNVALSGRPGRNDTDDGDHQSHKNQKKMYLRFAAMILTSMVFMYWVMFAGTYAWSHVEFSRSRVFMALTMGGTMGLVMFAWMRSMYRSTKANIAVIAVSILLLGGGIALDRTQTTVGDVAFMRAMIPHHSLAITRAERFDVDDARVCELAVEISEAQRREIREMEWLIADINENGVASTPTKANKRPVPRYDVAADLVCNPD